MSGTHKIICWNLSKKFVQLFSSPPANRQHVLEDTQSEKKEVESWNFYRGRRTVVMHLAAIEWELGRIYVRVFLPILRFSEEIYDQIFFAPLNFHAVAADRPTCVDFYFNIIEKFITSNGAHGRCPAHFFVPWAQLNRIMSWKAKNSEVIEHFVQQQRLKILGNRQRSSTK